VSLFVLQIGVEPLQSELLLQPLPLPEQTWLSQLPPLPQSLLRLHSTQVLLFVLQIGVEPLQSELLLQPLPPPEQTWLLQLPPLPQSLLRLHSTQVLLLQMGVDPPQSLFRVHDPPPSGMAPVPPVVVQVFVVKLHDPPLPQSRSLKHWTHAPSPEQSGAREFLQSLAEAHSTHCPAMLQMCFVGSVQSVAARHWTHMLWAASQSGVAPLHPELDVQLLVH
jgi:hypothetical protein